MVEADHQENILFRAIEIPHLLLDIPVPTIAAMTGHAIGGGFMVGMWCDMPVLAEESRYGMNAVTLGVPPVMGATEILPEIIGASLTQRLLYTGRLVKGRTFKANDSGLASAVYPKADVWPHALTLAKEIAENAARCPRPRQAAAHYAPPRDVGTRSRCGNSHATLLIHPAGNAETHRGTLSYAPQRVKTNSYYEYSYSI